MISAILYREKQEKKAEQRPILRGISNEQLRLRNAPLGFLLMALSSVTGLYKEYRVPITSQVVHHISQ